MSSDRKRTIIAGSLYIFGTVAGILSIAPEIDSSDYLLKVSENANQVIFAALFQFIMTIAYVGFAITLYPILRNYNESLALGFLSFRIIAAVLNIVGFIILLLLLSLSQKFVMAGMPDSSFFQTLGDLLRSGRDFMNHVAMILASSVGGLIFYYLLYQTKLVPRWLSIWGLFGTIFTILASFLIMYQIIDIITTIYFVLNFPLILSELTLAIWFIIKGFNIKVLSSIATYE
ncbi:MAG: hypothetical protein A2W99_07505 [Bacteroidetes bacterium GWF2_33_16]|nr:MAG: hypothetical protein A2X00_10455 [Bacteroidetes bacterium GWE2_32_14]OFY03054.1 MAG: hypothetical protein A2W99_07505 [Bacteroidetes bacterium GWF2_33_16]